jgi:hypothetical protein
MHRATTLLTSCAGDHPAKRGIAAPKVLIIELPTRLLVGARAQVEEKLQIVDVAPNRS